MPRKMGWDSCGTDSKGRRIGYRHRARCDHPGCKVTVNRGIAYACGGMHGGETLSVVHLRSCEGYFCEEHMAVMEIDGETVLLCLSCFART